MGKPNYSVVIITHTAFSQFNSYNVTVRTELVEVCPSCFDKLSTNGGCNCPKLKTLYCMLFNNLFVK
ncbi:hypothetical protein CRENPOLYSF1_1390009 [Crenothrix polyspora]|uniref:Uncharacterized protein n=1 Tax=Crenothrix polyspora TaxID=360316 RepID=A0A1R4H1U6_9GAMM|nr:hypothetical protein CRENPOLYSF1_1390009 [Crenothrix polyspora]